MHTHNLIKRAHQMCALCSHLTLPPQAERLFLGFEPMTSESQDNNFTVMPRFTLYMFIQLLKNYDSFIHKGYTHTLLKTIRCREMLLLFKLHCCLRKRQNQTTGKLMVKHWPCATKLSRKFNQVKTDHKPHFQEQQKCQLTKHKAR